MPPCRSTNSLVLYSVPLTVKQCFVTFPNYLQILHTSLLWIVHWHGSIHISNLSSFEQNVFLMYPAELGTSALCSIFQNFIRSLILPLFLSNLFTSTSQRTFPHIFASSANLTTVLSVPFCMSFIWIVYKSGVPSTNDPYDTSVVTPCIIHFTSLHWKTDWDRANGSGENKSLNSRHFVDIDWILHHREC